MAPTPPPEPSLSNIALSLVRPPTLVMGIQYGLGWGHDNNQWTRIACLYDSIRPPRARPASIPIARYPRLLHFFKATILLSYIPHIQTTLKPSDSLYHSFFISYQLCTLLPLSLQSSIYPSWSHHTYSHTLFSDIVISQLWHNNLHSQLPRHMVCSVSCMAKKGQQ